MTTLKKKDFKIMVSETNQMDEFVNDDGGIISGDEKYNKGVEIKTGPINHTGDIKGIPQTTDDFAAQAIQPRNWWWSLTYGYGQAVTGKSPSTTGNLEETEELTEDNRRVNKMVEDILSNRSRNRDMVNQTNNNDVNRNQIPDIDELSDNQMIVVGKLNDVIDTINSNHLSSEELGITINHLLTNIDTSKIPSDFKNVIRKKI